jgi:hypothetical protein
MYAALLVLVESRGSGWVPVFRPHGRLTIGAH